MKPLPSTCKPTIIIQAQVATSAYLQAWISLIIKITTALHFLKTSWLHLKYIFFKFCWNLQTQFKWNLIEPLQCRGDLEDKCWWCCQHLWTMALKTGTVIGAYTGQPVNVACLSPQTNGWQNCSSWVLLVTCVLKKLNLITITYAVLITAWENHGRSGN